jgi:peptidoglycan-associated lipoprotein
VKKLLCATVGAACLIAAGCSKKVAVKPAPPPAVQQAKASAPEKPVISLFAAAPGTIDKGGGTTLRWAVEHANNVQIAPALGQVDESGSQRVFPNADTVYILTATGPGGTASATASVGILVHTASGMPDQATKNQRQELLNRIQDAYFDYDKHNIRPDAQQALVVDAKTKEYLASLGVPGAQLKTISYGKEKQVCSEHDEACWQKNRRAHITQEQ